LLVDVNVRKGNIAVNDRLPTLLIVSEVAKRCYLWEAVLWVSMNRFPIASYSESGLDVRLDDDSIEGLDPSGLFIEPVTNSECKAADLPNNPSHEEHESGDYHSRPEDIWKLLEMDISEADKETLRDDLKKSIAHYARQEAWDNKFDHFLDPTKSRLFLAFREGRLDAFGKRLPEVTVTQSLEVLDGEKWQEFRDNPWQSIPSAFWTMEKIDWMASQAEGLDSAFALIQVDTKQLMDVFPPMTLTPVSGVVRVGDSLIMSDVHPEIVKESRGGRPAHDWEQFFVEVARRLKAGQLPKKQESGIAEMQDWCLRNWKCRVARSTVLQKVKPYYDAFMRKSESRKA
jgi:hypothetical protein